MSRPWFIRPLGALVVLLVVLCSTSGCRDFALLDPEEPDSRVAADIAARLGLPFELGIGQAARLDDQAFVIRFLGVGPDSRCPRSVDCIDPGDVGAVFAIERDDGSTLTFQLWVPGLIDEWYTKGDVFQSGIERFRLLWVSPYPQEGQETDPGAWRVVLRVDHDQ